MNKQYHNSRSQFLAAVFTAASIVLFISYSATMYVWKQSEVVQLAYFVASDFTADSQEHSSPWLSFILATVLCLIPTTLLLIKYHFSLWLKSVSLLPAYLLLGFFTGIAPLTGQEFSNHLPLVGGVLGLILVGVALSISLMFNNDQAAKPSFFSPLWTNVSVSCVGMLLCMCLTSTDRTLHRQLRLAHALSVADYSTIDNSLRGENEPDRTSTAICALSLSKQGLLPERLFSIPGLHGSANLMPDSLPSTMLYGTHRLMHQHLKVVPVGRVRDVSTFLEKAVAIRSKKLAETQGCAASARSWHALVDYYLCALLLERELDAFAQTLPQYYAAEDSLPRHYREALAMLRSADAPVRFAEDSIYLRCREDSLAFPGSYWNYYFRQ